MGLSGLNSTKQGSMCLAQGHIAVTLVRLKPGVLRSRVKLSTTEPLLSIQVIRANKTNVEVMDKKY